MAGGQMASPQKENGYTPIANEIMEYLVLLPLNGTQWRIVCVVWRYTYGFSRKDHELSEMFISKAIGAHKRQVQREVIKLIKINVLTIIKKSTHTTPMILGFNKDYETWVVANQLPPTNQLPGSGLATQDKQYIDIINNNIPKKKSGSGLVTTKKVSPNTNLINFFCEEYKKKFENVYIPNWARDGTIIKSFLDNGYTEEYIQKYIAWFVTCKDDYLDINGRNIPLMKSRFEKYHLTLKKEQSKYPDQTNYFKGEKNVST
jgi:phage replication O-like protein O